jgi:putative transcriptional regulator
MSALGDDIRESLNEALAYAQGDAGRAVAHTVDVEAPDICEVRAQLEMSRREFADAFGVRLETVRDWEQGRRCPNRTMRMLCRVIQYDPECVVRVLDELDCEATGSFERA